MAAGAWPAAASAARAAVRTLGRFLPRTHSTTTTTASSSPPHTLDDYNRLLSALARDGDGDGALRVLRLMRQSPTPAAPAPTAASYTSAMSALTQAGRPHDAAALFDDMLAHGVAPDRAAFSLLLHIYSSHLALPSAARSVLLWMTRLGHPPSPIDYADLVFSFCAAGRLPDALHLLDEMRALGHPLTPHVYAPVLQAHCNSADLRSAAALLASMRASGCHPNVVIYNIYIHGLCKAGDFRAVDRLIDASARDGWAPDTVTYTTYIAGLCRCGHVEDAFRQLEVMVAKGLQLNAVGLNILLDHAAQQLDVRVGREVLDRCEELGFEVDVVTYNTAMDQLCKEREWVRVLKLFTDLLKKPIAPDAYTCNILISCLCQAGKFRLAKFVFGCRGFVANTVTCNILIHEFYGAGKEDELGFLFSDMDVAKIVPDTITYNTLVDCLCRSGRRSQAASLVRHIDDGYPAEPVAHLAYWLFRSGHVQEALRLFDDMVARGASLDGRVFANVIKAFCRKGTVDCSDMTQLCSVLDRMLGIG